MTTPTPGTEALARALHHGVAHGTKIRAPMVGVEDRRDDCSALSRHRGDAALILAALSEGDAIALAAELLAAHPERLAEALHDWHVSTPPGARWMQRDAERFIAALQPEPKP